MAKWVLDWHSVLEYPTLGFHAEPGDILDAVYAPDARWSQNADQLAAETVYRFAIGGDRSEEHTSELQSLMRISYAVFCLKKKHTINIHRNMRTHPLQVT